jgi:hypothetical protein
VSADHLTFLIPSDSFQDREQERALLAAVFEHLTPDARARSADAAAFVAEA